MNKKLIWTVLIGILAISINCTKNKIPEISIVTDTKNDTSVIYALNKLTEVLETNKISFEKVTALSDAKGKSVLYLGTGNKNEEITDILNNEDDLPQVPEAISIKKTNWQDKNLWVVRGYDDNGLMYALLDIADRISWSKDKKSPLSEIMEITEKPDAKIRAVSIYTMNRAYWESRFYDEAYWEKYLDMLAKNRFNSLLVVFGYENGGFLAPCYPYFFDVDGFPDVNENHSRRTTKKSYCVKPID